MKNIMLAALALSALSARAAFAEIVTGEVSSVHPHESALYLTHRDRTGAPLENRFIWDPRSPETRLLENVKPGERLQLDAFRTDAGWKIRAAAVAPPSYFSVADPDASWSKAPSTAVPGPGAPPLAPEAAIVASVRPAEPPPAPVPAAEERETPASPPPFSRAEASPAPAAARPAVTFTRPAEPASAPRRRSRSLFGIVGDSVHGAASSVGGTFHGVAGRMGEAVRGAGRSIGGAKDAVLRRPARSEV